MLTSAVVLKANANLHFSQIGHSTKSTIVNQREGRDIQYFSGTTVVIMDVKDGTFSISI